jgi:hypothetical protein
VAGLVFFILCGAVKIIQLYTKDDFGKIFYYKGYNYDRLASRLITPEALQDYQLAKEVAADYPVDNRAEAYKFLGRSAIAFMHEDPQKIEKFETWLSEVPPPYLDSFLFGIAWAVPELSEKYFEPFRLELEKNHPSIFYKMWGFRYIGYKYYGLLINHKKLMAEISPVEKWFFKTFLENFTRRTQSSGAALMQEISAIPPAYQNDAVNGIGMLVGAQMLFDPMLSPDYPLDSRFGRELDSNFRTAFYEGVGKGFAETLCRFWRKMLPPTDVSPVYYQKMLEVEWQRCNILMSQLPEDIDPLIRKGFREELQKRRYLNAGIRDFIDRKFSD